MRELRKWRRVGWTNRTTESKNKKVTLNDVKQCKVIGKTKLET